MWVKVVKRLNRNPSLEQQNIDFQSLDLNKYLKNKKTGKTVVMHVGGSAQSIVFCEHVSTYRSVSFKKERKNCFVVV